MSLILYNSKVGIEFFKEHRVPARLSNYSVIIATHNRPHFLLKLLSSLQEQTLQPEKVVIVVNGHGRSEKIDSEYKALVGQIRRLNVEMYFEDELNIPSAVNFALSKIETEWFGGISDDDLVVPTRFERQLKNAHARYDAIIGTACFIDENGDAIVDHPLCKHFSGMGSGPELDLFRCLWLDNRILGSAVLWRSEAVRKVGGMRSDLLATHDFDLNLKILRKGRYFFENDETTHYRIHSQNYSLATTNATWIEIADIIADQMNSPESLFRELLERNAPLTLARILTNPAACLMPLATQMRKEDQFKTRKQSDPNFLLSDSDQYFFAELSRQLPVVAQFDAFKYHADRTRNLESQLAEVIDREHLLALKLNAHEQALPNRVMRIFGKK